MKRDPLKIATSIIGTSEMAKALGVAKQSIYNWRLSGKIPAQHCKIIENLTEGIVTAEQLRPDIFAPKTLNKGKPQ